MKAPNKRLALLIDAENTSPAYAECLIAEAEKLGVVRVRRAYGNWNGNQLKGWKGKLGAHRIQRGQTRGRGKNAADFEMVIGAMMLLDQGLCDGFCLVSSDGDFTILAIHLRASNRLVYGFGERKASQSFVVECSDYFFLEELLAASSQAGEKGAVRQIKGKLRDATPPIGLLRRAVEACRGERDGLTWVRLAASSGSRRSTSRNENTALPSAVRFSQRNDLREVG